MKLNRKWIQLVVLAFIFELVSCGIKIKTTQFDQLIGTGTLVSMVIKHKGNKIIEVSSQTTFNNEAFDILDESSAEQIVKSFQRTSQLEDVEIDYSKNQTIIKYTTPKEFHQIGGSLKELEKQLLGAGFKKIENR
ncbi:hypothetical protein [Vagococcus fluvialis]|uniref:hypothetical protein n=1 Tax=Vagococcus fluvialis TaxID=2738 RepID=UPI0037964B0B